MSQIESSEARAAASVLVLGVGNLLQHDDGVGVHVIHEMMERGLDDRYGVELVDGATAGLDLIPVLEGRKKIIIIDALRLQDEPGAIYRFRPRDLPARGMVDTAHELGILQALSILEMKGEYPEVEIIGVVAGDVTEMSMELTLPVREAIPSVIQVIEEMFETIEE